MGSLSSSKSKSRLKGNPLLYKLRQCGSGETSGPSAASWKALAKRSPWLKLLRPHQVSGVKAALSIDGFAALFEQRTGKTWVTGAVLEAEKESVFDVLLIGPLTNLESTWLKFITEKLPFYRAFRNPEEYLSHRKKDKSGHCILLMNYEALTPLVKKLRRVRWDRVIYDEAQRLKNRSSRSARDAALIAKSARKRLALTGTPMDLDPKDLWSIMRFVEVNALGDKWGDFEKHFLVQPTIDLKKARGIVERRKMMLANQIAKRKAPMRPDRLDEFASRVNPHVLRITQEEAGMARANVHILRFDLDEPEEKEYRKLEKNMVFKSKKVTVKTPLKVTQIVKLQQLTGGHIKDEDGELHRTGTSKRRFLRRMIQKHVKDEPFVVFCKFVWEVHMIERVLRRMGFSSVAKLWGKVKDIKTDKRRTNMLLGFQQGKYDAIICQQKTGGVGVDLYRARKAFVYSMGHSFIDYDQMISRLTFLDQDAPADFFVLAVRWSIDTDVVTCHKKKRSISEQFYDRLKH